MSSSPDLSLPSTAPELGAYGDKNWDDASFALYTLTPIPLSELQAIASTLEKQWIENQGNEGPHLVRVPLLHDFAGKSLKEIVQAHIELDKEETPRDDGAASGDLGWYPTAFLVLVKREWEDGGLLFVFANDEEGCLMDKFFFRAKDAHVMLSSIAFGDEDCVQSKKLYEIEDSE